MRFGRQRPRNEDERILPLINVVFLLLIFFMLAGKLAATDPFPIEPPQSTGAGPAGPQDIQVQVGADGRLALDGKVMDEDGLMTALTARRSEAPETRLRLKADGATESVRVVTVMELLRDAGFESVKLLTLAETR